MYRETILAAALSSCWSSSSSVSALDSRTHSSCAALHSACDSARASSSLTLQPTNLVPQRLARALKLPSDSEFVQHHVLFLQGDVAQVQGTPDQVDRGRQKTEGQFFLWPETTIIIII